MTTTGLKCSAVFECLSAVVLCNNADGVFLLDPGQMLKALMPVLVYSIGVALSKDIFKCHTMSNMAIISVGVAIAAYGEANFNALGVIFQLSALVFEATRLVLIQVRRDHILKVWMQASMHLDAPCGVKTDC